GRTGLEVDLDAPVALPDLPAAVEVAAYRIVQEALTNAARHSGAGTVKVNVDLECDGALIVAIKDDGGGLPDRISPGVGLTSMRERAEDIGGSLTISSDPSGTWVRAVLPAQAL
ncbi:MAG: sensor histidine kinase, partial [Acidimicrobiia bacterium]